MFSVSSPSSSAGLDTPSPDHASTVLPQTPADPSPRASPTSKQSGDVNQRRRKNVVSGGLKAAAEGVMELASDAQEKARDTQKGETKGEWLPAAIFIFISHVLVISYVLAFVVAYLRPSRPLHPFFTPSSSLIGLTLVSAWLNLLGVTAGYHRLWSHRAYRASFGLRVLLAIIGLMSFQGSARWWALKHRLHHRFTDTPSDPYDATRGLWYSHMGWLFEAPPFNPKRRLINMKDLDQDVVVVFQKRYLLWGYLIFGGIVPGLIGLYTDGSFWLGAFWIGFIGRFISWHCIWTINSFSHWEGYKEFSTFSSAVYVALLNLVQNGEGHHNYHHAFVRDYRHGHRWYDWDPTKWMINLWWMLGMATDLYEVDQNQVLQAKALTLEEEAAKVRALAKWGPKDADLPTWTMQQFEQEAAKYKGKKILMRYREYVLDVTSFNDHPGGRAYLSAYHGRDITRAFEGEINLHTQAAYNMTAMYRVAIIKE